MTHLLQNSFASSEHKFAESDSLRYCYYYHFRGQWNNIYWQTRKRLRVIWLLISFNENALLSEDGEKLQNLGDHFKALVQLGHLRVKDVFVGNISKNYTKIGYSNQHHDNLFSLFILLFFFFSLSLFQF